ncbi:MAG: hypothetical protein HG422_00525 [Prevotella sp.]|nr:hypothetical protein [Prevotella sp.]
MSACSRRPDDVPAVSFRRTACVRRSPHVRMAAVEHLYDGRGTSGMAAAAHQAGALKPSGFSSGKCGNMPVDTAFLHEKAIVK